MIMFVRAEARTHLISFFVILTPDSCLLTPDSCLLTSVL